MFLVLAKLSIASSLLLLIFFYLFGFANIQMLDAGGELLVGPILSLVTLAISVLAWYQTKARTRWHKVALTLALLVLILWTSFLILIYLSYSNCPDGFC